VSVGGTGGVIITGGPVIRKGPGSVLGMLVDGGSKSALDMRVGGNGGTDSSSRPCRTPGWNGTSTLSLDSIKTT